MGIFSFFKKLGKENKVKEITLKKLAFSEINNWIGKKRGENEAKEKEILFLIKDKIKKYNNELNEKIRILEAFDVEAKKEKDEIKGIVNNSRKDYIESVEDFLEKLNNLKMNEVEESMKKINKIFFDFNKSSYKNYERTTILIGKEMASIRDCVKAFSRELLKIYEENKNIVDFLKTSFFVELKLNEIAKINKELEKIKKAIGYLDKDLIKKQDENRTLNEKLEEFKKSQDYMDFLDSQKRLEILKQDSRDNIFGLKQLIDFKALANFFHINQEQMKIVKNHKDDFYKNFIKDNGKSIMDLLDEAKLSSNKILEKVDLIKNKIKETEDYEQEIKKDKTQELYSKIKETALEIDNIKIEKAKNEKRNGKLKTSKEELMSILKKELGGMGVDVA